MLPSAAKDAGSHCKRGVFGAVGERGKGDGPDCGGARRSLPSTQTGEVAIPPPLSSFHLPVPILLFQPPPPSSAPKTASSWVTTPIVSSVQCSLACLGSLTCLARWCCATKYLVFSLMRELSLILAVSRFLHRRRCDSPHMAWSGGRS